ncbi:MAG: 50S ribosome-binding GTPase [Bacteroidetes bacterium]|nr:50S ribosome-binding GTPase [Bacteroidota bacterium]
MYKEGVLDNTEKVSNYHKIDLLRFATAGSVDDGKSTLIGRLLFDTQSILDDQLKAIENTSKQRGNAYLDLSLLTDGLRAEREQGITIDVAYRYFSTPKRKFIIADCPGHVQYTRNMITGASTANLVLILIDAQKGVTEQTRRHAFLASLLQIKHAVVCINKMDTVAYSEDIFTQIRREFLVFASKLSIPDIQFIPISALTGDNVVTASTQLLWYKGPSLLYTLEHVNIVSDYNRIDCRFPIQLVIRPQNPQFAEYRGYAGRIEGGIFKPGDEVVALPSGFTTKIKAIFSGTKEISEAFAPMSVELLLEDQLDISRGDMLVKPNNRANQSQDIEVMICWMHQKPLQLNGKYLLRHTSNAARCIVKDIRYKVNINTLHRDQESTLIQLNDIGRILIRTTQPLLYDSFAKNKSTGSLLLIDEYTNETLAAGMIL